MQFQVRLVHAEPGSRVVAVSALQAGQLQATALGEGRTAEEAEDRAWQRLRQRLGWQRAEESAYLERAFGHPSRGRITTYADLLAYLQALEGFEAGSDPACVPVPLRRRDLLLQSDALLRQLGWDAAQGRARLEQEFACSSRQQLSDAQLLHFNMLLEEALLASGQCGGAPEAG